MEHTPLADHRTDAEISTGRDSKLLEATFKTLWEKVRKAVEVIDRLREENQGLKEGLGTLEQKNQLLETQLRQIEDNLQHLKNEQLKSESRNNSPFSEEEKNALRLRIKDLLTRINSHL